LTEHGRNQAEHLRPMLAHHAFKLVLTSPMDRASQTCALAGLGKEAVVETDLVEWGYGGYEGLTLAPSHEKTPGWRIFTDGSPGGEMPCDVAARVDRVISNVRAVDGDAALFGHGHVLRVLAARWIGLPPEEGQRFLLDTGTLGILGHNHGVPAI